MQYCQWQDALDGYVCVCVHVQWKACLATTDTHQFTLLMWIVEISICLFMWKTLKWTVWIHKNVKDPRDGVCGDIPSSTTMQVSVPVQYCRILVSVWLCLQACIYMETLPQTVEDYIMASVRARWRVQHGGWLLQLHRSWKILPSLSPSASSRLFIMHIKRLFPIIMKCL